MSGHCPEDDEACQAKKAEIEGKYLKIRIINSDWWTADQLDLVLQGLDMVLESFDGDMGWFESAVGNVSYQRVLVANFGDATPAWTESDGSGSRTYITNYTFESDDRLARQAIVHEAGHAIDISHGGQASIQFAHDTGTAARPRIFGRPVPFTTYKPNCETVAHGKKLDYAATNEFEEFAETFAALVVTNSMVHHDESYYDTTGYVERWKMSKVAAILSGYKPSGDQ